MILLGITGAIGHGKTSLVNAMQRAEPRMQSGESSLVISEVANHLNSSLRILPAIPTSRQPELVKSWLDSALPEALRSVTPIPFAASPLEIGLDDIPEHPELYEKLWLYLDELKGNPDAAEITITPENKDNYRPFLQWIGGYVTTKLDSSLWYAELVRRASVAEAADCPLYIIGGIRLAQDADALQAAGGIIIDIIRPELQVQDLDDTTERTRGDILVNSEVINNGTLADLDPLAERLIEDLRQEQLKPGYQAKAL